MFKHQREGVRALGSTGNLPRPDFNFDRSSERNSTFQHKTLSISSRECSNFRMISPDTLVQLMERNGKDISLTMLDCRFKYEYDAGTINGAINLLEHGTLLSLFKGALPHTPVVVFFCEFSSKRSPKWCKLMRCYDRLINVKNYPELRFPYLFLLENGYNKFYKMYGGRYTGGYRSMFNVDEQHVHMLKESNTKFNNEVSLMEKLMNRNFFDERPPQSFSQVPLIEVCSFEFNVSQQQSLSQIGFM